MAIQFYVMGNIISRQGTWFDIRTKFKIAFDVGFFQDEYVKISISASRCVVSIRTVKVAVLLHFDRVHLLNCCPIASYCLKTKKNNNQLEYFNIHWTSDIDNWWQIYNRDVEMLTTTINIPCWSQASLESGKRERVQTISVWDNFENFFFSILIICFISLDQSNKKIIIMKYFHSTNTILWCIPKTSEWIQYEKRRHFCNKHLKNVTTALDLPGAHTHKCDEHWQEHITLYRLDCVRCACISICLSLSLCSSAGLETDTVQYP